MDSTPALIPSFQWRFSESDPSSLRRRWVDSGALHPYRRKSLGRAQQRGRGIAAIIHVGLKRVRLHLIDLDAVEAPIHEIGDIERTALGDIGLRRDLDGRGDLIERQIAAGQRRGRDHVDFVRRRF